MSEINSEIKPNQEETGNFEDHVQKLKDEGVISGFEPLETPTLKQNTKEENEVSATDENKEIENFRPNLLGYIENNRKNEGGWQNDFDFAKKLADEGKVEEALKLALLAREAQIKEGSQKETPAEHQI